MRTHARLVVRPGVEPRYTRRPDEKGRGQAYTPALIGRKRLLMKNRPRIFMLAYGPRESAKIGNIFYPRFQSFHKRGLRVPFIVQRRYNGFVHTALYDKVVAYHWMLLPLSVQTLVGLLVQLKRPIWIAKPHSVVATGLQIQSIPA